MSFQETLTLIIVIIIFIVHLFTVNKKRVQVILLKKLQPKKRKIRYLYNNVKVK